MKKQIKFIVNVGWKDFYTDKFYQDLTTFYT